jgi:hypothetical protein
MLAYEQMFFNKTLLTENVTYVVYTIALFMRI